MGWSTSIHIATTETEEAISRIRDIGERECFVGVSGSDWVGVYSMNCEKSGGVETPNLTRKLSTGLNKVVLGLNIGEDGFYYWLFESGRLLDRHPVGRLRQLFPIAHRILDLAKDAKDRQRMQSVLSGDRCQRPHEIAGLTEEEFIAKASRDLARVGTMLPDERNRMGEEYSRIRGKLASNLDVVCKCIGVKEYSWSYSDFSQLTMSDEAMAPRTRMRLVHVT